MFEREKSFVVAALVLLVSGACSDDAHEEEAQQTTEPAPPDGGGTDSPPVRAPFGLDARPNNTSCRAPARPPAPGAVKLEQVYTNVKLERPMAMAMAPGDATRWFVALRDGRIVSFPVANPPATPTLVGDVAALAQRPVHQELEAGLLGMAFHPKFATNGRLFVSFTTNADSGGYASEVGYLTTTNGGASFGSYTRVLAFPRPKLEHNGGGIAFGKDGYLYLGFGDATDPTNGQKTTGYFAKILRIDVDNVPAGATFGIPSSNPFAKGGGEPAMFARGFRNPYRLSIDRETGELWAGDVGDAAWEEINRVPLGGNMGWPCREGAHDKNINDPVLCPSKSGLVDPIVEHAHAPTPNSRSITGGIVYRGKAMPAFRGTYVYGDLIRLEAWALSFDLATGAASTTLINEEGPQAGFTSFAEDADGEIYAIALFQNSVYKLVPNGTVAPSTFPDRLSKTGCVDPADPKRPGEGVVPFGVNVPLWSDGAEKERWLALPNEAKIAIGEDGDFDLPIGSVLMKTFSLAAKPVETRLFVRHDDGEWAGYSYAWNAEGSDAELLDGGKTINVGTTTWTFPSRSDCSRCHTKAAGRSLGLELGQLNGDIVYRSTNRIANQLATLEHIGMLTLPKPAAEIVAYPALTSSAPVEARARAYLHANCSGCHRPEGGAPRAEIDLRFFQPFAATKTCNEAPKVDDLDLPGAKIITPGAPDRSVLSRRVRATDAGRMPPLGTRIVDGEGANVLDQWITSLAACP